MNVIDKLEADELVMFLAEWENISFSAGCILNDSGSLFDYLDTLGDPHSVVRLWVKIADDNDYVLDSDSEPDLQGEALKRILDHGLTAYYKSLLNLRVEPE